MLSRAFIVAWLAMFTAIAGIAMVSPLLPVYVQDELHGPEFAVALSFSALAISQLATAPFIGRFGDRYGFKPFIVGGFLVYAVGALGYLVAPNWQTVVFFRIFSGFGAAGVFPMSMAYIGRLSPPGHEGRYMGVFAIAMEAGYGFGPLFGGGIRDAVNTDAAFAAMAGLLLAVGIVTLFLLPANPYSPGSTGAEEAHEPLRWEMLFRRPLIQAAVLGQTLISVSWGATFSFIAVYVVSDDGLATGSAFFVGVLIAARSTVGSSFQVFTGRAADTYSRTALAVTGIGISALTIFIIPDVPVAEHELSAFGGTTIILPWLLLAFLIAGIGEAIAMPAVNAVLVDAGRSVGMGSAMGLAEMGQAAGFLGGSLIGAAVVQAWGLEAVFRYAAIVAAAGAVTFLLLMRRAAATTREAAPGGVASPVR